MTTITRTMENIKVRIGQNNHLQNGIIPENITSNVRAIIYCRSITEGKMRHEGKNSGIFIRRSGTGWSAPVALHFLENGTIQNAQLKDGSQMMGNLDLMILICDQKAVQHFEGVGQVGWTLNGDHKIKQGIISKKDKPVPPNIEIDCSYAYIISSYNNLIVPANVSNGIVQFRSSSTEKFYRTRNANLRNIMHKEGFKINTSTQNSIDQMTAALDFIFHSHSGLKTTSQIRLEENSATHTTITTTTPPPPPRALDTSIGKAAGPVWGNVENNKQAPGPVWGNVENNKETNLGNEMNNLNINKPTFDNNEAPEETSSGKVPLGRLSSFNF